MELLVRVVEVVNVELDQEFLENLGESALDGFEYGVEVE